MKGTVKSKTDIERLFREGRRSSSYLMSVLVEDTACGGVADGRLGFIAGKKLGTAPLRNRCKRILRECARELGGPWQGVDVVFVSRYKLCKESHQKVLKVMERQLRELDVIGDKS